MPRLPKQLQSMKFLSTPSARRATDYYVPQFANLGISIHALREEGDLFNLQLSELIQVISIHALREEGDRYYGLPTKRVKNISIHALREEGDVPQTDLLKDSMINFYPRPPRGGRPGNVITDTTSVKFLSTPSARRATVVIGVCCVRHNNFYPRPPRGGRRFSEISGKQLKYISIHALREEGDVASGCKEKEQNNDFYPRPPRGGRR